jgi:anti-sigma28 factor (negative regulator of flagellin synthesis)
MEIRNVSNGNGEGPRTERATGAADFRAVSRDRIGELAEALGHGRLAKLRPPDAGTSSALDAARELRANDEDRVDVSKASEALAAEENPEAITRRHAHIDAIREAIAEGKLVTPERLEAAVKRLLGN